MRVLDSSMFSYAAGNILKYLEISQEVDTMGFFSNSTESEKKDFLGN